jgi:hypothetical protein
MQDLILSVLVLALSIPLAFILASLTKDEKNIYTKYFTYFLIGFGVLAVTFYFLNQTVVVLTLVFMFLTILIWRIL